LRLVLPLSCRPACIRLGVVSCRAYKDGDDSAPPGYTSPGCDATSGPGSQLLLPLPFPALPFHFLPFLPYLLRLSRVNTGRFRCRRGRLSRSGRDACDGSCMLGVLRVGVGEVSRACFVGWPGSAIPSASVRVVGVGVVGGGRG
jgi:hypothetical protein